MAVSALSQRAFYGAQADGASALGGGAASPMFDGVLNGTGDFISTLSAVKSRGARCIMKFVGRSALYMDSVGSFRLDLWKARMDLAFARAPVAQVRAFVEDGTLLASYMIDDFKKGSNVFAGGVPNFADIEEMAQYSKSTWSFLPCTARAENTYFQELARDAGASNYTHLDFGWSQWMNRFGPVLAYYTNHVNAGRQIGLGALLGCNLLNAGSGATAPWNIHPGSANLFGMSPEELEACANAASAMTYGIGFNVWSVDPDFDTTDYWHYTGIQSGLASIANVYNANIQIGPINWRDQSGGTSGSSQTVAGSWNYLGKNRYRANNPLTTNVTIPSGVEVNGVIGVVAYSRDSGRSSSAPSGFSTAQHASGTSLQGGDLALYYKIADGSEGGMTVAVPWSGSVTDTACQCISFAFSGNTTSNQSVILATAGSIKSWTGGSDMGPIPGLTSAVSDALVIAVAARVDDFNNSDPVPDDTMSATTSGGETWNRMILSTNIAGSDSGVLIDYATTSGVPSIATKSWSQLSGQGSSASGSGVGFMVAFAPATIVAGQPPAFQADFEDITMSVASTLSFQLSSTGSAPITYSKVSGPSNMTVQSGGTVQWSPTTTGTFLIVLRATNSFGSDTRDFTAIIVSSGATSGGGSGANAAPSITNPGNKSVTAHDLLSFIVAANDSQNDAITFNLDQAPTGSFIDSVTGQFVWIPSGEQGPGTYPIVVVASDGLDESRSTFTVTVNDTPWTREGGPSTQLGRSAPDNSFKRI